MPVHALNTAATAAPGVEPRPAKAEAGASFAGALAHASSAADTPNGVLDSKQAPKGETTKPVAGHAYADILTGPRNGMYVNTSGNKRDGQAFVLVKRDGKEFHVYGTGKDRLVVCLKRKPAAEHTPRADASPAPPASGKPSGTTGAAQAG